jgi:hypothetical protein
LGKTLAVAFTTIGGLFYLAGAFVGGVLAALFGIAGILLGKTSASGAAAMVSLVFYLGIASGIAIIVGGALVFASPRLRKIGAIIVLAFAAIGAIPAVFGMVIGLVLALVGGIVALTYKEKVPVKVTRLVKPDGSVTTTTESEDGEEEERQKQAPRAMN